MKIFSVFFFFDNIKYYIYVEHEKLSRFIPFKVFPIYIYFDSNLKELEALHETTQIRHKDLFYRRKDIKQLPYNKR